MRFGIHTLDEFDVAGKTVLCRLDLNQPVDRATGTLKSTARIEASVPTVRELSDKGAKLVLLAHQGSDIEYKNFYCTRPHADVLNRLLERPVQWIDDVCGPAAREKISDLQNGEILLLDNVRWGVFFQLPTHPDSGSFHAALRHFSLKYVSIPAKKCLAQRKNSSLPVTLGVFRYTLRTLSIQGADL